MAPLLAGHERLGVIVLISTGPHAAEEWVAFARLLGTQIGYAVSVARTLSQLREAQRRESHQLSELELIYRTAPVGLALIDADFRFARINERLAEITGRPVSEHVGRTVREVIPGACRLPGGTPPPGDRIWRADPNGGRLRITTSTLNLDASQSRNLHRAGGRFVCLEVADTGSGIPPEYLDHIFEPFFTTKEVGKGTGLGLASGYGIVTQHNGWIEVSSKLDEGTTFRVILPAAQATESISDQLAAQRTAAGGSETILLVEDDEAVCRFVKDVLDQFGYTVLTAASGVVAQEVWQEHAAHIDVLITDMVMPGGLSGAQLAEALKAQKPNLLRDLCQRLLSRSNVRPSRIGRRVQLPSKALYARHTP